MMKGLAPMQGPGGSVYDMIQPGFGGMDDAARRQQLAQMLQQQGAGGMPAPDASAAPAAPAAAPEDPMLAEMRQRAVGRAPNPMGRAAAQGATDMATLHSLFNSFYDGGQ